MSIQSQIDRVTSNVSESYTACSDMGATLPDEQVSDNLPTTIRSIPKGSVMTNTKIVTEVVYPLSSETNYTGIEAISSTSFDSFRKVADNLYTKQELQSKKIVEYWADKTDYFDIDTSMFVDISDNGSFLISGLDCWVIMPEDVGKTFLWGDDETAVFPEAGTYLWYKPIHGVYCDMYIPGTYKREIEVHDFDVIVEGECDSESLSVTSVNKSYYEIAEALRLKKDVRAIFNFSVGEQIIQSFIATVEVFSPELGRIEFGFIFKADLGEGEQVYHFKVTLTESDTLSTEYESISGDSKESEIYITTKTLLLSSSIDIGVSASGEGGRYYHKVVDNVYTQEELTGKRIYIKDAKGNVPFNTMVQVQSYDIGKKSFRVNNDYLWVIAPEDANKEILDNEGRICIFPEPGTYMHQIDDTQILFCEISGEYRKPVTSNDFPLKVNAYSDWMQFPNISRIDCSYEVIRYALQEQRPVVMTLRYDYGDLYGATVLNITGQESYNGPIVFTAVLNEWYIYGEEKTVNAILKITIDQYDIVTSELIPNGNSSEQGDGEPVQEIVYMDCFIDLQHLTATIEVTYDEIAFLIESGKYVVGRGTYALVASPINLAYLPMSAHNKEESSIYFKGLSQMVLNGVTAVVDITLILKKYSDNVFKARVISIAKELN